MEKFAADRNVNTDSEKSEISHRATILAAAFVGSMSADVASAETVQKYDTVTTNSGQIEAADGFTQVEDFTKQFRLEGLSMKLMAEELSYQQSMKCLEPPYHTKSSLKIKKAYSFYASRTN